jgi:hypothetical protein
MTSKDTQIFNEKIATDTAEAAAIASEDEHNTSTMQAFKQHLWGLVFGHRNVYSDRYEHYDGILISNLIAYPLLKKHFGTYYPGLDQCVLLAHTRLGHIIMRAQAEIRYDYEGSGYN